ncbi:MAG: tandem-95 repeat protein, partial [Rhodoferax sp.]|uniref:Ig-like domain-containing protein n=1 Tax=Rhodoferax sp. TaxID=50421 RepID=UPI00301A1666
DGHTQTQLISLTVTAVADITDDSATVAEDSAAGITTDVLANDSFENSGRSVTAVTQGTHGTVAIVDAALGTVKYTPNANYNGADSYTYTVTSAGVTETATVNVTVTQVNDPASFGSGVGVDSGSGAEDGAAITGVLTVTDAADGMTTPNFRVSTVAGHGTASIDAVTGAWSYTPVGDYNGADSFVVSVTDNNGNTETKTISLTVTAVADITDDAVITPENTAITVNVITGTNGASADSFEGTPVLSSVTQGAHGSVSFTADGSVTYTPVANYSGVDSFTYTVTSPAGVTETATFNITVVNDLIVNSIDVNEASLYAVFNVSGVAGQSVSLVLAGTSATGTGTDFGAAGATNLQVSLDNGATWTDYSAAVTLPAGGGILVRTPVVEDNISDNNEAFTLTATPSGGSAAVGTATIKDDGTGTIYNANGTENTSAIKTDDRAVTVSSPTVSEASPYVVFTVTGLPDQLVSLSLASDTATVGVDTGSSLQYFDGTAWQNYIPGSLVAIPAGGTTLLVRTAIINDTVFEVSESLRLKVSNSGGVSFEGIATIKDDASSSNVYLADNRTGVPTSGEANDDQPKPVAPDTVAPVTPTPEPAPVVALAEPAPTPAPAFNSATVVTTPSTLPIPERVTPIAEILTSVSGFRVVVADAPTPGLSVFRGITDQFIEGNKPATFSLPADAFVHTKADSVVTIFAKLANGDDLPAWVQFDARSGTFKLDPPAGFNEELQIKVIARDNEGREATSLFKFSVGKGKASTSSRSSLSEQIRLASTRSTPWLDLVQAKSNKADADKLPVTRLQAVARQMQARS